MFRWPRRLASIPEGSWLSKLSSLWHVNDLRSIKLYYGSTVERCKLVVWGLKNDAAILKSVKLFLQRKGRSGLSTYKRSLQTFEVNKNHFTFTNRCIRASKGCREWRSFPIVNRNETPLRRLRNSERITMIQRWVFRTERETVDIILVKKEIITDTSRRQSLRHVN